MVIMIVMIKQNYNHRKHEVKPSLTLATTVYLWRWWVRRVVCPNHWPGSILRAYAHTQHTNMHTRTYAHTWHVCTVHGVHVCVCVLKKRQAVIVLVLVCW